jgi:hypothetical protein
MVRRGGRGGRDQAAAGGDDDDAQSLSDQTSNDNWNAMYLILGMEEDLAGELVEGQKLNSWSAIQSYRYNPDKRVEQLFKGIAKVELEDEDGNTVRIKVPERDQHRFRQLVHYAIYQDRRQRSPKLKECTPELFDELEAYRHIEESYKPSPVTLATFSDDITKIQTDVLEQWNLEFSRHLGQDGIDMRYLFRKNVVPKPEDEDDEDNYATRGNELVNRYRMIPEGEHPDPRAHYGPWTPAVQADLRYMSSFIVTAIGKTRALTFAERGIKQQNARMIYYVIVDVFCGPGQHRALMQSTETKLQNMTYTGDKGKWNFNKAIQVLEQLFNQHDKLVEQGANDGNPMGQDTKVNALVRIFRAPWCEPVRTQILANAPLQRNYAASRNLLAQVHASEMASNPTPTNTGKRNSSALKTGKKGGKSPGGGKGGRKGPPRTAADFDKGELKAARTKMKPYVPLDAPPIPSDTYRQLSEVERFALWQLRQERDSKGSKESAKLKAEVARLKSTVAQLSARRGDDASDSDDSLFADSDEEKPPKKKRPTDNRGNGALDGAGRQRRR